MALAKDLSDLPSSPSSRGALPVKNPTLGPLLAKAWAAKYVDTEEHPLDLAMSTENARIRFSWAGSCARQIGYQVMGEERTEPLTLADHWRFGLGHLVHDQLQAVLIDAFGPGAEVEVTTFLEDGVLAGHADVEIWQTSEDNLTKRAPRKISVEIKTINGFGYKKAVGARGPAEGPRTSAKLQGALNALARDADELVIIYLAMELLSPWEAQKIGLDDIGRFCAEWRYTRDQFVPAAEAERDRMLEILAQCDAGILPDGNIPYDMPPDAVIDDPAKGKWTVRVDGAITDGGGTWQCNYCAFQSRCVADMRDERKAA